jgi:DNA-binding MarR family transcriptional regulator
MSGSPLSPEHVATWRSFLEAHAAIGRQIDRQLEAAGLPPLTWYDVVWALYEAPGRRLRMGDLAGAVLLSRTGLTRLVDRIEAAGHLRRDPVPGDRRGTFVVLTPSGVRLLRRMWPVYERCIATLFVTPLAEDHTMVGAAMERAAAAAGDYAAEATAAG